MDAKGEPIFHDVPKSYPGAESDGERWRWMLTQVAELDPVRLNETDMDLANFLRGQFGVQTMAAYGIYLPKEVLDKVYRKNAERVLYGAKD